MQVVARTPRNSLVECPHCGDEFTATHTGQKFCSQLCNVRSRSVSAQRNWLTAMLNPRRKADGLTIEDLEELWKEQGGLCALSGVPLTMTSGSGGAPSNVSIDRIEAGGKYSKTNVQLVCKAVNSFRNNLSQEEFIWWCTQVTQAAGARKGHKSRRAMSAATKVASHVSRKKVRKPTKRK